MHFTDPDDEDRSRNNKSIFDKFKRKNSTTGGNSMPVTTRISELSNMADLSQEDALAAMSADRRGKQRLAESSGMASSYTQGQTSQGLDGTDPDSTFNVTRESNESTTQKKRKAKFSFNPFKRRSKAPETSSDPKAGISEDSTVGGDRSCDEQSDRKKTTHLQNGLLVQNVPYDKEMQESVDQYSMIRGADTFNEEMGDDTVKSFADGGYEKRVKFNEVPESTRATECQERAVNMALGKKTGNYTKIIN